jgi:hypothetical protein
MMVDGEQRALSLQIYLFFFYEIVATKVVGVGISSTYKELWDRQFRR